MNGRIMRDRATRDGGAGRAFNRTPPGRLQGRSGEESDDPFVGTLTLILGGEEMAFRATCVALLLSSLPIAGCGTVANLFKPGPEGGGMTPFGGVRQDVSCIKTAANGELSFVLHPKPDSAEKPQEPRPQVVPLLLCAADLPFTLIGDVVTLPYVLGYLCVNEPVPYPPVILAPPTVKEALPTPPATLPMPGSTPPATLPMPAPVPPAKEATAVSPLRLILD